MKTSENKVSNFGKIFLMGEITPTSNSTGLFLYPTFCLFLFSTRGQNSHASIRSLGHSSTKASCDSCIPQNLNLEHGQHVLDRSATGEPCLSGLSVPHLGKRAGDVGSTNWDSWRHSWWISRTRKFLEHHPLQPGPQLEGEGREELAGGRKSKDK